MEYIKGQVMNRDFINNKFCLLTNGLKDVIFMII